MQIQTIEGLSMGGTWRLRLPARRASSQTPEQTLVQATFDLVEAQMSAWRPQSALSRINAAPVGKWVDVPADTAFVIKAGLDLMQVAPAAFSILIGGAQAREGFVPGRVCGITSDPAALELRGHSACRRADIRVDLNAIAKGYAADLVAQNLIGAGHSAFLIEVAGDIVARGQRPDGLPWTVALELPIPDRTIAARLLPLHNIAVATSGGYRRAVGGRSHLLQPRFGQPMRATDTSVAVMAHTGLQADGLATVLAVLGANEGLAFAATHGLAVIYIEKIKDGFVERGSPAMADLLDATDAA